MLVNKCNVEKNFTSLGFLKEESPKLMTLMAFSHLIIACIHVTFDIYLVILVLIRILLFGVYEKTKFNCHFSAIIFRNTNIGFQKCVVIWAI